MFTLKMDEIPDEGLELEWTEEKSSLSGYLENFPEIDFDFEDPLRSKAKVSKSGRAAFVKGKVETSLRLRCVRCLKEFFYPLVSTFELALLPLKETSKEDDVELEGSDLEAGFYEEGELHLSEIACEQVFLEIPYQPLCREGCKGLCPVCGSDLNLSSCQCAREGFPSGFAVLKDLKLDQ